MGVCSLILSLANSVISYDFIQYWGLIISAPSTTIHVTINNYTNRLTATPLNEVFETEKLSSQQ